MRVLVPLYALGPAGHALYDANVQGIMVERVAEGWLLDFLEPSDRGQFLAAMAKLGVKVLDVPRDTATGLQSGMEPKA